MEQLLPAAPVRNSLSLLASSASNNIILAFCLDGNVYALDERNGKVLWRVGEAFTNGPLLQQNILSPGGVQFILEPIDDGSIFTNSPTSIMQKLPFNIKEIVQGSPVRWQGSEADDSRTLVFIGKRETSLFAVDVITGLVTCRGFTPGNEQVEASEISTTVSGNNLLLGRSDFHLQAFETDSLKSLWSLTWSQFKSIQEAKYESKWSFFPSFEGFLVAKSEGRNPWMTQLSSPVLQLFKPVKDGSTFALSEISLQSAKPSNLLNQHIQYDRVKETFYFDDLVNVGVIKGALFVLPQSRYMLLFPSPQVSDTESEKHSEESENSLQLHSSQLQYLGAHRIVRHLPAEPVLTLGSSTGDASNSLWSRALGSGILILLATLVTFFVHKRRRKLQSKNDLNVLQVSEQVLGVGSHGTIVYRGHFDGRPVAVKRLLADFFDIADREIGLLQQHDSHPNIIRYFYREKTEKFIYIALELASLTLAEWVEGSSSNVSSNTGRNTNSSMSSELSAKIVAKEAPVAFASLSLEGRIKLFEQIMQGIAFLHRVNLVHRDLKPQNILIKFDPKHHPQVLISDFGLSKRLVESESSFHATAASGTLGWRAPELIFNEESAAFRQELQGPVKIGRSIDIFAAGLVLYYLLSDGQHAFGTKLVRESNIVAGKVQVDKSILSEEADDLLKCMLKAKAKERPSADAVLKHPFFWSPARQLAFVCAVSDALEGEERQAKAASESAAQDPSAPPGFVAPQPPLPMREAINSCGPSVFPAGQNCWHKTLDRAVFSDLTRHRYYLVACVHDLLRVIRNKRNHFSETPAAVQDLLGTSPEAAWLYFKARFPRLLLEIYRIMRRFQNDCDLDSFY